MTVYVVEDSPVVRDHILSELAHIPRLELVGVASSALDALNEINRIQPDLVLLDLNLSPGTGLDVLKGLSDHPRKPLVYMVSNTVDATIRSACHRAGATRFFDKTRDMERLFEAVRSLSTAV